MAHASVRLSRLFAIVALLFLLSTGLAWCGQNVASEAIVVTPDSLENGSPFLLTVSLHETATAVTGSWQGHPVEFFSSADRHTWFAIAGVDVEVVPGTYPLTVQISSVRGAQTLHKDLTVGEAAYTKVPLTVPDKFVEPDALALKKIAADKIVKDKAFANSATTPQWSGNFVPPLHLAPQSDSFGNQRLFNGKLASVHRGLDYHAKMSTPVAAINSGRVVLARPLYFEGGCVVIDHGLGLMSVYMHLSKFQVKVGQKVRKGQVIALSGASGRATGPHLHLGVRWQGSYLDPAKLFEIKLQPVRQSR
jgi:murein DD-endopeptidase MepM/ murein hydrolase activator NlpD